MDGRHGLLEPRVFPHKKAELRPHMSLTLGELDLGLLGNQEVDTGAGVGQFTPCALPNLTNTGPKGGKYLVGIVRAAGIEQLHRNVLGEYAKGFLYLATAAAIPFLLI